MQPPKCKFGCGTAHWSGVCPKPPKVAIVKQKVEAIAAQPVKLGSKGKAKKAKAKKTKKTKAKAPCPAP